MADIIVTPANVFISSGNKDGTKFSIESMQAGDLLFLANNGTQLGVADSANATDEIISGGNGLFIALNRSVASNQPITIAGLGTEVDFGAGVLLQTEFYAVSPTAPGGKIIPLREIVTGEWVNVVGYAKTDAILVIQPIITKLQKP